MGSSASEAGETAKKMPKAIVSDIRMGLGIDPIPRDTPAQEDPGSYINRTKATVAREKARNNPSALYKEDDRPAPRQSTMARAAAPSYGVSPVGSAPDLPDPDQVGETEQALLDANRKGRSSTIATSPAGLLAGEDSTRKKRSLMGGLIR